MFGEFQVEKKMENEFETFSGFSKRYLGASRISANNGESNEQERGKINGNWAHGGVYLRIN